MNRQLNTLELQLILKRLPELRHIVCKIYGGIHAADQLHDIETYPKALIVNTDPIEKPGQHWVAIFFEDKNRACYFDSFGERPNKTISNYLKNIKTIYYNTEQVQPDNSYLCGLYCVFFLRLMAKRVPYSSILSRFSRENLKRNDRLVLNQF